MGNKITPVTKYEMNITENCNHIGCNHEVCYKTIIKQKIPFPDNLCHPTNPEHCTSCSNQIEEWKYEISKQIIKYSCYKHLEPKGTWNKTRYYDFYIAEIYNIEI